MHTAPARRRALLLALLALLLALALAGGAGALRPGEAPGRGAGPVLTQPAGATTPGASTAVDRLRAVLLARWRRALAALLGTGPAPGCPQPPARNPGEPAC